MEAASGHSGPGEQEWRGSGGILQLKAPLPVLWGAVPSQLVSKAIAVTLLKLKERGMWSAGLNPIF